MTKQTSYRKQQLPNYIEDLKTIVEKNFEVMVKDVESDIADDKFYNVVKGRKMASEGAIYTLKKIDRLLKEVNSLKESEQSSYYKEKLPELIEKLKVLYRLNTDIMKLENDEVTEEKLHNVIKSREMAEKECEWALEKIDELENELTRKEEETVKVSWAKRAAERNK